MSISPYHDLTPENGCAQPVREQSVSELLAELDVAGVLVSLLRSSDGGLLHSVVVSLTRLSVEDGNRRTICKLDPIDPLLGLLRDGEHNLRMAAAELLLLLGRIPQILQSLASPDAGSWCQCSPPQASICTKESSHLTHRDLRQCVDILAYPRSKVLQPNNAQPAVFINLHRKHAESTASWQ